MAGEGYGTTSIGTGSAQVVGSPSFDLTKLAQPLIQQQKDKVAKEAQKVKQTNKIMGDLKGLGKIGSLRYGAGIEKFKGEILEKKLTAANAEVERLRGANEMAPIGDHPRSLHGDTDSLGGPFPHVQSLQDFASGAAMTPAQFQFGRDLPRVSFRRAFLAMFGAANSPTVSSPCRGGFLFGAVAGSAGQTPAAIQTPSGGFGYAPKATARTALPANAVAAQGGM